MNTEFKRMMKLAGLAEIVIKDPFTKNPEDYENIKTLEELELILRKIFRKAQIELGTDEEAFDDDGGDEPDFVSINGIEITPGAYQLWDVYDTNTDWEQSFMSTPELLIWIKDHIK